MSPVEAGQTPSNDPSNLLKLGRAKMAKGQADRAMKDFADALSQEPNSCECNFLMGEACSKSKKFAKARKYYRQAIRVGRGSKFAKEANVSMMKLPQKYLQPRTGPDTRLLAKMFGLGRHRGDGAAARPTVIDFYASWCQPCKQLDEALTKVQAQYGDKIMIMRVDVDDPKNEGIIDQYEVSPIPTVVFLNTGGEVVSYSIGYAGDNGIDLDIKKILGNG
ncbi:MAG: hypothetical protein K2Z81_07095 [Cyanobacteria bacterium]|nr:hypothetical protein [Cyanobacteriota bacterium]